MAKMFYNYNRFRDDTANALVESLHDLSADVVAKENDTQEYSEKNAQFNLAFAKYCVEAGGDEFSGLEMLKNPMMYSQNTGFCRTFQAILAQAITPVVPMVTANNYTQLFDAHQVGWGK